MFKKNAVFIIINCILIFYSRGFAQTNSIKGQVTDSKTGETLIGCNVFIQGTTIGATTDLDGNYEIKNVAAGDYNLVSSYISYNQKILRISVSKEKENIVNFQLEPATVTLQEVKVTARKRFDTEMSMINSIKSQDLIVSGISGQQIQKSQDKDAAEVLRRIPGITITDGRFVIVRGLMERYNTVTLNSATAPSSEADVRAFSFDVIPSNMIDNILIFKTPAPELPSDFAGASINVITKNFVEQNSVAFSYATGYTSNATGKEFYTYKGGKIDWLGIDDGTRALPKTFPAHNLMNDSLFQYADNEHPEIQKQITKISQSFRNDVMQPYTIVAKPNQSFAFGLTRRFVIGKATMGNITSVNYSNSSNIQNALRAEYENVNPVTGKPNPYYYYTDDKYINTVRAGIIHNWLLTFGHNHKIEFRNFLNQNTTNRTVVRNGINYTPDTVMGYAMEFIQRTTYSGQLAGQSHFNDRNTEIDWLFGYSYANKLQPDFKRLLFIKQADPNDGDKMKYRLSVVSGQPLPERGGRFYLSLYEHIQNAALNLKQNIHILDRQFVIKTGIYIENKAREFSARNIGLIYTNTVPVSLYLPLDSIYRKENFFTPNGFAYSENTLRSNRYQAKSNVISPYIGIKVPFTKKLNLYTGARFDIYKREIFDFQKDVKNVPNIRLDTTDIFFSANLTYDITENNLVRFSYGKTVNRPEFREIAPLYYLDFDLNAGVWGNDTLKNAYIHNFDLRYEWYPSPSEMISVGLFYKKFIKPIEILLVESGGNAEYKPFNADYAESKGIEFDVRKDLTGLGGMNNVLRYLKNLTIVFNASVIRSEVTTTLSFARDTNRVMMGQSPYILNTGLYYNTQKHSLMLSLIYNRIGKRIVAAGTKTNPHTWELPRNSLDFTLTKNLYKGLELRVGIKDILNEPYERVQYDRPQSNTGGIIKDVTEPTIKYKPGTQYTVGLGYKF